MDFIRGEWNSYNCQVGDSIFRMGNLVQVRVELEKHIQNASETFNMCTPPFCLYAFYFTLLSGTAGSPLWFHPLVRL
jgi:hypothetical protein